MFHLLLNWARTICDVRTMQIKETMAPLMLLIKRICSVSPNQHCHFYMTSIIIQLLHNIVQDEQKKILNSVLRSFKQGYSLLEVEQPLNYLIIRK